MKQAAINTYPDQLITDYLNSRLNLAQKKELEQWIDSDPAHKKYYYELTEIWLATEAFSGKLGNKDLAYYRFKQRIEGDFKKKHLFSPLIRYAAAAIIIISLISTSFHIGGNMEKQALANTLQSIEVPLGSRTRIVLQDGTTVWLNAGSKLSYNGLFLRNNREIMLEGEGYFEVTPRSDLPFIVNTEAINVKVLGTKFNIKANSDESDVSVALAEGSVNFINKSMPASSLILKPKQLAVYNKESKKTNVSNIDPSMANMWITGSHFFNEQSLAEITQILGKVFDVKFVFRNQSKKELTFYADFRENETLSDILQVLSSSKKFSYKKKGDIIEIY